jgi:hypothetical protein
MWASAIEPFLAVFHMILGAPNYHIAGISTACWLFIGGMSVALVVRRKRAQRLHLKLFRSAMFASGVVLLFISYLGFAMLVPLPSGSLVLKDSGAIVADLHSHTVASHDAIASPQQNLRIHQDRGYGVVAWTEHYPGPWPSTISMADLADGRSPEVIPGLEISITIDDRNYHLLLLRIRPDVALEAWLPKLVDDQMLRSFCDMIHAADGVVVAVNWKLNEQDIGRLVADGVDGFEIANLGHPWISSTIHAAMIKAQRSHNVALIANSDWHGWSGFFRTWTVVKSTDAKISRADEVISALRKRDVERIIPVVSQMFETPSTLRIIFSPFAEALRYGGALQPLQLVSWWIWTLSLIWVSSWIRRVRLNPARIFLAVIAMTLGFGLMFRGFDLLIMSYHGVHHKFPLKVGLLGSALGIATLFAAWWMTRNRMRPLLD